MCRGADAVVSHEHYAARPHPEFVVLEIGEDLGALVIHADAGMHGMEIEISPSEDDRQRSHKEVLERAAGSHPAYTAVFDQIPAGTYTLWTGDVARLRDVRVEGGQIAELRWPAAATAAA
jgi:hypothetical protein